MSDTRDLGAIYARDAELAKQVQVDGDHIVINVNHEYLIPKAQADEPAKILGWVMHLADKTWVTKELLQRFIEVASKEIGLDVRQVV